MRVFLCLAALVLPAFVAAVQAQGAPEQFEITVRYDTRSQGSDSSGSSRGGFRYREDVDPAQGACRVRRFDGVDDPERKRPLADWQMPVAVRECAGDRPAIANREEMLARLEAFLAAAGFSRDACGKFYFTWSVFKIECDPETVLDTVAGINLGVISLEDGAEYPLPETGSRVTLALAETTPAGQRTFTASGAIDPAFLREEAVQAIMVVAEVSGEAVTRDQAMAQLEGYAFSGEAKVTLVDIPAQGTIVKTLITDVREVTATGEVSTRWGQTVVTRKRAETVSGPDPLQSSAD